MSELSVSHLSFSYDATHPVISDLSFSVRSDERLALEAPSGAGKTTLCQLLAGYLMPDAGTLTLDGQPLRAQAGKPYPAQLIWQHPEQALDPYLRIKGSFAEAGDSCLELAGALGVREAWLERFPHELSGGELQRCCIARALSVEPKFLIADEISTMLDAVTQVQIWNFLLEHCARTGIGMIVVTHSNALRERIATRTLKLARATMQQVS